MKKYILLQLAAFYLIVNYVYAQDHQGRVPYKIYDNFNTGETFTWEPYPYQQDTGYDPAFGTKKEPAYGLKGSALSRITRPNDATDLSQGFTKRIDLYALESTRVKFVFFMMSDRKPETMEVSLGTFGGKLYTHTIRSPQANTWVEVDLPIEAFTLEGKALNAGDHLQVIVVKAFYPVVSHLFSYTILMDEFSITGERPRQFLGQSPSSTWFEQFGHSVINRHYAPGETFSISVAPEGGIKLKEVNVDLITPNDQIFVKKIRFYDDGTHGDIKASDGIWSNSGVYEFKLADPPGQWKARFTGVSATGPFTWDLRFIVPVSRKNLNDHPRVFVTSGELAARRARLEPEAARRLLDNFIKSYKPSTVDISRLNRPEGEGPESLTGGPYSRAGRGGWYDAQNALARIITSEAWHFTLTGDKDAGEKAKGALVKLCTLSSWNHPWMEANGNHTYFPGAPAATASGIGYDLLYHIMTEQERATVRKGIMDNAIKPFYRDMVELNRMPSSNSNHIAVILSGVGIAAVAIANDDPDIPGLEPYLSGILAKTRQFIDRTVLPEGSYNEPYTYQQMALRELVGTLYAFEKNLGVDYTSTTYLKEFYYYALYATQNNRGKYQDLGDVSPAYSFVEQPAQWLVYKMKDPFMYKYVKPAWDSGSARGEILPYLWYTENITPISRETLPTSKHFEGKGHMVMRSGWDDSGSILIFKAGPNGNHYHYDQGTILLTHNGEELLSDAGHSNHYYANLYYPGYYTQPIGHNVMLVDMNPESQSVGDFNNGIAALRNYPKITHSFTGENADAVEGDLTNVYKGAVSSYTRSILSTKNGPIFLFDKVKSPQAHSFNWLFHAEHTNGKSSIDYIGNRMTITRPLARLTMDVLSPEPLTGEIRNSDREESFIALSSAKVNDAVFLAVMKPEAKPASGDFLPRPKAVRLDSKGWIGASLKEDTGVYYGFFKIDGNANASVEGFTTDASRFTATVRDGRLSGTYFEGSRFEGYGVRIILDAPATVSVTQKAAVSDLEVKIAKAGKFSMAMSSKPAQVTINGTSVKNLEFDHRSGLLSVNLPEGQSKISIR